MTANFGGTMIWVDPTGGNLGSSVFELLAMARGVAAQLGGPVSAVATETLSAEAVAALIARGADRVLTTGDVGASGSSVEVYFAALEAAVATVSPALVLFPHSSYGAELAPRLAARLESAAAMDCIGWRIGESGALVLTRQCYGGKARADVRFRNSPGVATIRAKSQTPLDPVPDRKGEVVELELEQMPPARSRVLGRRETSADAIRLEDARVVVAGGRGVGGPAGFVLLETLAETLGGAVGASRPACDLGWYPHTRQIGVTGKTVAPELYIAVGISGASQHLAGCGGAKVVVAINNDPEAAIFSFAHLGVVGSFEEIIPPLREILAEGGNSPDKGNV